MAVEVVQYYSAEDLLSKKICLSGTTFASFEDFYIDENKSFIRKDLIFSAPTVVLSEVPGSFRVEIVFMPNPFEHADAGFQTHMKSNIQTLSMVKEFLWPLGTVLYRVKKGSMFAWGWCKERTSSWFLRYYLFKTPPKEELRFSDQMTSGVQCYYKLFQSRVLSFCRHYLIPAQNIRSLQ